MRWWPSHHRTVILLLLATVPLLVLAQSPCGPTILAVNIPEYPFINSTHRPRIPPSEYSSYRALLVPNGSPDLSLTLDYDPHNHGDINPNEVFRVDYLNAFGNRSAGWYLQMVVGLDRDGTFTLDDDRSTLQAQLICQDPTNVLLVNYHLLQVQLEDRNDNAPTFQHIPYSVAVSELTAVGVTVFSAISTLDSDKGNNRMVQYRVDTAANSTFDGTEIFTLASADSPFVVLKNPLDYEAMVARVTNPADTIYRLNITATDKPDNPVDALSSWTLLTLSITDGDDLGPQFVYPSCFTFSNKSCIHAKYDATIVSEQTGPIQNILPVPRDVNNPTQNVVIKARDGDALSAVILCYITDTFPLGYQSKFRVTTSKLGSTNEYRCNIEVTSPFRHSLVPSLEVLMVAEEQTNNRYINVAYLTLTVAPSNLYRPELSTNSGTFVGYILENSVNMTQVKTTPTLGIPLRFVVNDGDLSAGDPVPRYDIVFSPAQQFGVDDNYNVVLLGLPLDYESRKVYNYVVVVTETDTAGPWSSTISLTINVLDVNDNDPTVPASLLDVTVPEGDYSVGGQMITKLQGNDQEDGTNVVYTIFIAQPYSSRTKFHFQSDTLILQARVVRGEMFCLIARVSDRGNPSRSTLVTVLVRVTSSGDQPPQFSSANYTIFVSEGVPVFSTLWSIPIRDPENETLTLTTSTTVFDIQRDVLNFLYLRNLVELDRETTPVLHLVIQATDSAMNTATTSVIVYITDVNDQAPTFSSSSYTFSIVENSPQGTTVGRVTAVDRDQPDTPFSTITYSLQDPSYLHFQISSRTGEITSSVSLDYERTQSYVFNVLASDGGVVANVAVVQVTINVIEVSDSPPTSLTNSYTFSGGERCSAADVGKVLLCVLAALVLGM